MSNAWKYVLIGLLVFVLVFAVALPFLSGGWSRYGLGMMGPGMMGPGIMRGWWGTGVIGPILLLVVGVLIVGGIALVVQALTRSGSGPGSQGGGESALDILKRRFASGEITREQFEEMRKALES